MSDINLQERISKLTMEGYKFLGKEVGQMLTEEDAKKLLDNGMGEPHYAIKITYVRYLAKQNGNELRGEAAYDEVINAMKGPVPDDLVVGLAANYFSAMCHLMTEEEQEKMVIDLNFDAQRGVPYAREILLLLMEKPDNNPL